MTCPLAKAAQEVVSILRSDDPGAVHEGALERLEGALQSAPVIQNSSYRVRKTPDRWLVERELPCINRLSAWSAICSTVDPSAEEYGYTDGACGTGEENARLIAAALNGLTPMEAVAWQIEDSEEGWVNFDPSPAQKNPATWAKYGWRVRALAVIPTEGAQTIAAEKMVHILKGMIARGTAIDSDAVDRALTLATYQQDPTDADRAWAANEAKSLPTEWGENQ